MTFDRASVVRPEVPAYLTLTLRIWSLLKEGCRWTNSPEDYPERRGGASESALYRRRGDPLCDLRRDFSHLKQHELCGSGA